MAAQTVNVADVLLRIREVADIETNDQATSSYTDARLTVWLNQAYRALYDLITDSVSEVGEAYFATSASVGPSSWTLPAGTYRVLGIDHSPLGVTENATYYDFVQRNVGLVPDLIPRHRVQNGSIVWRSTAPTAAVTVWYIPSPSDLASNGSFDAFNGWDDYITYWVAREIRIKQELDIGDIEARLGEAAARIRRAAKRIVPYSDHIVDVETLDDSYYYNS